MSFFISILHFIVLSFIIYQLKNIYKKMPLIKWWYFAIFTKITFGVCYGYLYIKIYGGAGDSLLYFKEVSALTHLAYQNFELYWNIFWHNQYNPYINIGEATWQQERVLVTIKFLSILQILTYNNYWIQGFYLSFLSAWGMWKLANVLVQIFPKAYYSSVIVFFIFPSIQLWSSGYTKESITMFFLSFSLAYFLQIYFKIIDFKVIDFKHLHFKQHLVKIICMWIFTIIWLYLVKFYYLATLLPTIFAFILADYAVYKLKIQSIFLKIFTFLVIWFIVVLPATQLHNTLKIDYFLLALVYNHNSTYIHSAPQDLIHYSIYPHQGFITLEGYSLMSFLYNSPTAFFSACFRPFLWETYGQKLKILMALENTFFLFSVLISIFCLFKTKKNIDNKVFLLCVALLWYSILLLTILAFASPNFGGLMRYRIAVYPFLLYFFFVWIENYVRDRNFKIIKMLK